MNPHNILLLTWLNNAFLTFLHVEVLLNLSHLLFVLVLLEQLLSFDSHVVNQFVAHQIVTSHPIVII